MTKKEAVSRILHREDPGRIVYAPNYWQWDAHVRNQRIDIPDLPKEHTQLDVIRALGLDLFSRNIYADPYVHWFGGLVKTDWEGVEYSEEKSFDGRDILYVRSYRTRQGTLSERLRYIMGESTLVQEEFLVKDFKTDLPAYREILKARRFSFRRGRWKDEAAAVGDDGVVVAGEVYSPLKMFHIHLGAVNSVYALTDYPDESKELLDLHEEQMLTLIEEMAAQGVPAIMSMDNLDAAFHPPQYVESYSASFYRRASAICHRNQSTFFIHACGQQRANIRLISGLGVDGLEGVAFPPLGDIELEEAMELSGDSFIITGGISAMETRDLSGRDEVFAYVKNLFTRMRPYRHRFIFSASCNTSIDTSWETLLLFRDAWNEYKDL
jgi:Uroporphyrinogen decarboxylase (URO-D)